MNYQTALVQLPLVREVGKERVVSPADVYRMCADTADLAQEAFHVVTVLCRARHKTVYAERRIMPRMVFSAAAVRRSRTGLSA